MLHPALAFKALDTTGNADLEAGESDSAEYWRDFRTDAFYASVDFWQFDFEDPFQIENGNQIVGHIRRLNVQMEDLESVVRPATC